MVEDRPGAPASPGAGARGVPGRRAARVHHDRLRRVVRRFHALVASGTTSKLIQKEPQVRVIGYGATLLIKTGRARYAWITLVPLASDAAVTLAASYQKIFSDNPELGFWAQREQPSAQRGELADSGAGGWSRLRAFWQFLRELAGERDYERYLAHRAAHRPGEPVLSERAFWRERTDRQDRVPSARCC